MRSRGEIVEGRRRTLRNAPQASLWYTKQSTALEAILEVLLDIRDLLQPRKIRVELDEEGFEAGSLGRDE